MIVRITGTLIEVGEGSVVVDRDGLAWEVLVPRYAIGELAACRGREITLHTSQFLEGNQASGQLVPRLLGFLHVEDKIFFSRLTSVKGIGTRKALKALAEPARRIATWIKTGDIQMLTRLPGLGKRAAELIVATLHEKMDDLALPGEAGAPVPSATLSQPQQDALEVLIGWGDARGDAERWLERAAQLHPESATAEEWIRAAYRIKSGVEG